MTSDLSAILPRLSRALDQAQPRRERGRVREVRGVIVHASLPSARIGELCELRDPVTRASLLAEVIGFEDNRAVLTAIGGLEGLSSQCEVIPQGRMLHVPVGEALLGRVIDPLGQPLDGRPLAADHTYPAQAAPPPPMQRDPIRRPLALGVRAIDGLATVAEGQRIGIFGEAGAGKSSLLAMVMRQTAADVIVIGLIGERGREVRDFLDLQLGAEARARTVAVVATSDRAAIERVKAAHTATAVAEYFRDQGRKVLLLVDSLTRFARAQREIGLAAGEPPTRRGFPPSFFSALPKLLERAGTGVGEAGSITAIYTVLMEGDGALDPVAEEAKSILDGHIMLSPELAQRNHYPAIDILNSRSRLMSTVAPPRAQELAGRIRESMAEYDEIALLVSLGEYTRGTEARFDAAIEQQPGIEAFLRQRPDEPGRDPLAAMEAIFS